MKNIKKMLVFAILLFFAGVIFSEGKESVKLNLDQPTKTERKGLPVFGGLPFAKGALPKIDNLRLLDNSGKEQPLQARALSLWPDGSVKSAMLDFQYNIPRDKDTTAVLEYGAGVKSTPRATGLQIKKTGGKVTIDTGVMQFSLSKSGCGFMDEVTVDGKVVGTGINFARFKGDAVQNKVTVSSVEVEEGGDLQNPLRAVVKVEGVYEGHLKTSFVLRLHFYAGKSFVRVFHSFVYVGNRHKTEDHLTELEIGIELTGGPKKVLYGIEGEAPVEPKAANGNALLYSKNDIEYEVTGLAFKALPTNKPAGWWMDSKGKPAGWMSVSGAAGTVQMGVRDLWQNYPKGLRVEGNKATLALWPKEHAPFDLKTNHRFFSGGSEKKKEAAGGMPGPWNDSNSELDKDPVSAMHSGSGKGASKTHELFFNFRPASEPDGLTAAFTSFQEPTYMFAGAKWYADCRFLNPYNPAGTSYLDAALKEWEKALELSARWILYAPRYWRWYGMWDYGELVMCGPKPDENNFPKPRFPSGPRPPLEQGRWDNDWRFKENLLSNAHYDLIEAMLLHYLRTGKREYFRFAEVYALHVNEVDSYHPFGETATEYRESVKKGDGGEGWGWGREYGLTSRHGAGNGQVSSSHSFLRFRMPLYYLTGNERVKESMRLAYEFILGKKAEIFGNGVTIRNISCATKILETWWSISGEKEAEEHVKFILHYWISRQQSKGDLGNFVGINKSWGKGGDKSPEAFNPYKFKMDGPNEIPDPNSFEVKKTIGWRLSEFGTIEAMMDWYNITGDEKVGQSVVRFIRATKTHGSWNNWYKSQQMLSFAWGITKEEVFRNWLKADLKFNEWSDMEKKKAVLELKDNMGYGDFHTQFSKMAGNTKGIFAIMHLEKNAALLLHQPYAMYAFEPYDKAFPPALSTGGKPAANKSPKEVK
jgi:hypothetical protein